MPPSGFTQDAINGLLVFVEECYNRVLDRYDGSMTEPEILEEAMGELETLAKEARSLGVSEHGIRGLADFMRYNFMDVVEAIRTGVKPEGYAVRKELEDIRGYLGSFTIHESAGRCN